MSHGKAKIRRKNQGKFLCALSIEGIDIFVRILCTDKKKGVYEHCMRVIIVSRYLNNGR